MKRYLIAWLLLSLPMAALANLIQMPITGGGASTTWDPAEKGTDVVLSGSNLVATVPTSAGFGAVLATTAATGKHYAKFTITTTSSDGNYIIGLANASILLNGYLCFDASSQGQTANGGACWDSSCDTSATAWTSGDSVLLATDTTVAKAWVRVNGTWGGTDNPSTNTGGCSYSVTGTVFLAWSGFGAGADDVITANFSGTDADSKLSGFTPYP